MESYKAYNKQFFEQLVINTEIQSVFDAFGDTAWWEKYTLNAFQFSAAKDLTETKMLQKLALTIGSKEEYEKKANEYAEINRDYWLNIEVDTCKRNAVLGEKWRTMEKDKDLYPYWVYRGRMDGRERPEHIALEGKVFRIGDPEGDRVHPICAWNCFIPGTKVLTKKGKLDIDNISVGDKVIGGSGNEKNIDFIHQNMFNGNMFEIINKRGSVTTTNNHRILTIKGWKTADSINIMDIVVNKRKSKGINKIIRYVNNSYVFACYIIMSLIIKGNSAWMKAFNSNIKIWQKYINPIRTNVIIKNIFNIVFSKKGYNFLFIFRRLYSCTNMFRWINSKCSFHFKNDISHSVFGFMHRFAGLLFRKFFKPLAVIFGFTKIGMWRFRYIFSHCLALIITPFICVYPLCLYGFTSFSNWNIKMIKSFCNSSVIFNIPSLLKFSKSIKLIGVKFIQNNGSGAPLDSFNTFGEYIYNIFTHNELLLVYNVNIKQYSGYIYNLSVENDESYIVDIGIVHNCRCTSEPVDERYLKQNDTKLSKGSDYLEKVDPKTGLPYVDKDFRFNPGQHPMPNDSSYFEMLSNINKLNNKSFGL